MNIDFIAFTRLDWGRTLNESKATNSTSSVAFAVETAVALGPEPTAPNARARFAAAVAAVVAEKAAAVEAADGATASERSRTSPSTAASALQIKAAPDDDDDAASVSTRRAEWTSGAR